MRQTGWTALHCRAQPDIAANRNSEFRAQCAAASSQLVGRRSLARRCRPARSDDGSDRNGAFFFRQPHLLDGSLRSQTDRRSLFPSPLDLVLRARLELARRPRLRCAVPCSGIGETFGVAPHRPQAVVMAWIAAAVAVFYSLSSVALALLFFTRLQVLDDRLSASVALVLPATGALPGLEDLLAALTAQSLRPRRLIVSVEAREDPAYPRVAALAERYPQLKIELGGRRSLAAAQPEMHQPSRRPGAARARRGVHRAARRGHPPAALVAGDVGGAIGCRARRSRQWLSLARADEDVARHHSRLPRSTAPSPYCRGFAGPGLLGAVPSRSLATPSLRSICRTRSGTP